MNGLGPSSPTASFLACIPPSGLTVPILTAVDKTTFSIAWNSPTNLGGCPLSSYSVLVSTDQYSATPTYVAALTGLPVTNLKATVTTWPVPPAPTGKPVRVKIQAINPQGTVTGPAL